ncbi:hypothetical protein EDB81DRAFT_951736 [Dactylonectria macrodidyma]|uniref:Indole-diterpene biosynthesis protein PaxU n=1 Tax=Dactylonectria macrodidyma TaxID=307937 RepID=A0A9P9DR53_9HYPO|nr:hypothetical protein EDB81DRAFT_951736 [Dactylonectria macrodidyma]
MASKSKPAKEKPLSFMESLSSEVLLYRPPSSDAEGTAAPKLIIIATWVNAQDAHIAKYVNRYKSLCPYSQILLVKSTSSIFFNPPLIDKAVQPMVPVIRACFPTDASSASSKPGILIHIFSNGGSSSISALRNAYASSMRDSENHHLPEHVTIFDSSPSNITFSATVSFFRVGFNSVQRLLAMPFIYLYSFYWAASIAIGFNRDWLAFWGKTHNEAGGEVRRTYIYSESDDLVDYNAIEAHADEAAKKGLQVKREKFDGSAHVSHSRKDEARYWEAVQKTWEGH